MNPRAPNTTRKISLSKERMLISNEVHPAALWGSLQCLCLLGHSFRNLKRKKALILRCGRFQPCRQLSWKRFLRELMSWNQINIFLIWKGQSHNMAVLAIFELYRKVRRQSPFCPEFKWNCYCKRLQKSRVNNRDSQEQMNRGKLLLETFWDYICCSFIHRFFLFCLISFANRFITRSSCHSSFSKNLGIFFLFFFL